jgi:hypothetical protein
LAFNKITIHYPPKKTEHAFSGPFPGLLHHLLPILKVAEQLETYLYFLVQV